MGTPLMRARDFARMVSNVADATLSELEPLVRCRMHGRSLRDGITHSARASVDTKGAPTTLTEWNTRQLTLAALAAFAYDCDALDALPIVAQVFPTIAPRAYALGT
jgi:hypothetical protein